MLTNAFGYFVSLHKAVALREDNVLTGVAGELALTLKAHKVAGLLGLPSDDAQAVVQAQDALRAEMTQFDFLNGSHVQTDQRFQIKSVQSRKYNCYDDNKTIELVIIQRLRIRFFTPPTF